MFRLCTYYIGVHSVCQCTATKNAAESVYAEQKGVFCSAMKKNQTLFLKLCLADALIKLMSVQAFDAINVNAICQQAGIGRTTFYRYFDNKNSKEDLLVFKICYEWECYAEKHEEDVEKDRGFALTNFIYENKRLFTLLYHNGLITAIMRVFVALIPAGKPYDKQAAYLVAFFTYGYFGIIYQWIKCDFSETPEQVQKYISETIAAGLTQSE